MPAPADSLTLTLSLTRQEVPVNIDDRSFVLREMMASERDKYMTSVAGRMRTDAHGNTAVRNFDGMLSALISRCLYDDTGTLVPEDVIQRTFPASVQQKLFAACQKLNGLDNQSAEDEKKS